MEEIKREVIIKHLEGWKGDIRNSSIEHFAKSGKVSGSLFMALKDMLDDYVEQLRIHNAVEKSEQYFCSKEQIGQRCCTQCLSCFQFEHKD